MLTQQKEMTFDEFIEFATSPENEDRNFEFIDGEAIEMSQGRAYNSEIGDVLAFEVRLFCRDHNLPCHTAGRDAAFRIGNDTIAPDFVYKLTEMSKEYPDLVPPLWVAEIISPTDKAKDIRKKREKYILASILYWELYPDERSIDVYAPGQPKKTYSMGDVLDGGDVLPGFTLAVEALFA